MSRCRADSFYLAPGEYRSFEAWSVFTKMSGEWIEITHRSEIAKLERTGSWDGLCYVTRKWRETRGIQEVIDTDPDEVEVWLLDSRSVNGKPDKGGRHHLSKVALRGVHRCGGPLEAVGKVLGATPYAKDAVRWFAEESVPPSVQAASLRLLRGAQSVLSEGGMQSLVARMRKHGCAVPMPEFDGNTLLDLRFLERYEESRRVTLLESLWLERVSEAVRTHARVCGNIRERGGDGRALADAAIGRLAAHFPEAVAKGISEGSIDCGGPNDTAMTDEVASVLMKKRRNRHLALLHQSNAQPDSIRDFIMDRDLMERDLLVMYEQLSPENARAALAALQESRSLSMTHSVTRCQNNLHIVMVAGGDNRMLEAAFAAWLRSPGSLSSWRKLDTDRLFRAFDGDIDARCAELLYKRQLEVARVAHKKSANDWCKSESDYMSDELMALLEASDKAPAGVREAAAQHLNKSGRTIRDKRGRLSWWSDVIEHDVMTEPAILKVMDAFGVTNSEGPDKKRDVMDSGILYKMIHRSQNREQASSIIETFERELRRRTYESIPEGMSYRRARAEAKIEAHVKTARDVAKAVYGDLTLEDLKAHGPFGYSNPVCAAAWEHSTDISDEVRSFIMEETGDYDLVHLSFLRGRPVDIVGGREGDATTKAIQLKTILHEKGDAISWPEKPKSWSDLPGVDHIPWSMAEEVSLFRGRRVVLDEKEYDVRVIDNMEDLRINSSPMHMGNCTDTYAGSIRRGDCLMLAIGRGGRTEINVSIERDRNDRESWVITEAKLPQNKTLPAPTERELRAQLDDMLKNIR